MGGTLELTPVQIIFRNFNLFWLPPLPYIISTMAVTSQPREWKYEVFDCMADKQLCGKTCMCPCLTACDIAKAIEENVCDDCIKVSFFAPCVLCQMMREINDCVAN